MRRFIPLLPFVIILIPFIIMLSYVFRYELHLVKPKFKANECGRKAFKSEFNTTYEYRLVLQVGKLEYNTLWYDNSTHWTLWNELPVSMEIFDKEYEKINCLKELK